MRPPPKAIPRARIALISVISIAVLAGPTAGQQASATPFSGTPARFANPCSSPTAPSWFQRDLARAVKASGDLPANWAHSRYVVKIACWQGLTFRVTFAAHDNNYHRWHGMFAMTGRELATIAGPAEVSNPNAYTVSTKCLVWGWVKCPHRVANMRSVQQLIAALRFIWLNYGHPSAAWENIVRTGRFNSYPRPGTNNVATKSPFGRCPVDRPVSYWDDFGQPRYVSGYHPHAGNDVFAPMGRPIRAPFAGYASSHIGGTRGGNWVTLVGAKGYVQNDHLSAFGHLGWVNLGTVIGYVGMTGDAVVTHDHFEWHPWVVPSPLHKAPSGFNIVTDAIDPFPFLNRVCP